MTSQNNLYLFRIQVSIEGYTALEIQEGLNDFFEELKARDYLMNPQVWHDTGAEEIRVNVTTEAPSADSARLIVYDDIFESVVASIHFLSEKGIKVKIFSVEKQT